MPENNDCPDCLGCGIIDLSTVACPVCKGKGKIIMDKKQSEFKFTEDKLIERASNLSRLSGYQSFEETADSALSYLRETYKQGWNSAIEVARKTAEKHDLGSASSMAIAEKIKELLK